MNQEQFQDILLPPGDPDYCWETFHENSKIGRYFRSLSDEEIRLRMNDFHLSLPYEGYPIIDLPKSLTPMKHALDDIIISRSSVRDFSPTPINLRDLSTLLHFSYGETRDNKDTGFSRPVRVVPSGGGLYPLEIFFYSGHVPDLEVGVYHYNPSKHHLRFLNPGEKTQEIAQAVVYPDLIKNSALLIFITAVFERSVFKYRERGYRFTLLEAGHVAQNLNLVSLGLDLGSVNVGGYFDREIDDFLGLDGVNHSTIYMIALGKKSS